MIDLPGHEAPLQWSAFVSLQTGISGQKALAIVPDILQVSGIDAFIVGPYDLSCSMGIPGQFDNPDFKNTLEKIIDIGVQSDISSGLHVVEPDIEKLEEAITAGHKFIAYSVDIRMLDVAARRGINQIMKI